MYSNDSIGGIFLGLQPRWERCAGADVSICVKVAQSQMSKWNQPTISCLGRMVKNVLVPVCCELWVLSDEPQGRIVQILLRPLCLVQQFHQQASIVLFQIPVSCYSCHHNQKWFKFLLPISQLPMIYLHMWFFRSHMGSLFQVTILWIATHLIGMYVFQGV